MKKIHLIGDSISIQYHPYLTKHLKEVCIYTRKQGLNSFKNLDIPEGQNAGDSSMVLAYLEESINNELKDSDYIFLNCGLHDIKTNLQSGKLQISPNLYESNLVKIFDLIYSQNIIPIWITTTHFDEIVHNHLSKGFFRFEKDSNLFHKIAIEVTKAKNVETLDLRAFSNNYKKNAFYDHVHFRENIRELQAAFMAGAIATILKV